MESDQNYRENVLHRNDQQHKRKKSELAALAKSLEKSGWKFIQLLFN